MTEQLPNGPYVRHSDGTLTPAIALGWQGPENQVDFEVTRGVGHWLGDGWCRDRKVTRMLVARTRLGFSFTARRHVGWRTPVTFLWDQK